MRIFIYIVSALALMAGSNMVLAHGSGGGGERTPAIRFNVPATHHESAAIQAQPVMELSIEGQTVILKITDADGNPIDAEFADAKTFITAGGKISKLHLWPAGGNVLSGTGDFIPDPDLRVEVKLNLPDRGPVSKDFYPLR